jgi:hypothetical protein
VAIEISKAKRYVLLSEHEMDFLDFSLPTVTLSSEKVTLDCVELSEFLVDSALVFYRRQQEYEETESFTLSVVKHGSDHATFLRAIRGFNVPPSCQIKQSIIELVNTLLCTWVKDKPYCIDWNNA